jgi:xanthine phosphoribosyltransferase
MDNFAALRQRIAEEAEYLGRGIIKVDSFLNHQIDPRLTDLMGEAFAAAFCEAGVSGVTKVVTAEVSGIAPAVAAGKALGVPVVYARKHRPITMPDGYFLAEAPSHTKGGIVRLMISPQYLGPADRVVLIDDFLATGKTIAALADLIAQSGATLCGIGCVIEKVYEPGREELAGLGVPVVTLAKVDLQNDHIVVT